MGMDHNGSLLVIDIVDGVSKIPKNHQTSLGKKSWNQPVCIYEWVCETIVCNIHKRTTTFQIIDWPLDWPMSGNAPTSFWSFLSLYCSHQTILQPAIILLTSLAGEAASFAAMVIEVFSSWFLKWLDTGNVSAPKENANPITSINQVCPPLLLGTDSPLVGRNSTLSVERDRVGTRQWFRLDRKLADW